MEPFDSIEKLINEHGSAVILLQRLDLAKEQYAALERRVAELTKELETVKAHNETLRKRLASLEPPKDKYVKSRGVLWFRTENGFEPEPYCPKCETIMFESPPRARQNWHCSTCDLVAPYSSPPVAQ